MTELILKVVVPSKDKKSALWESLCLEAVTSLVRLPIPLAVGSLLGNLTTPSSVQTRVSIRTPPT